MLTLGQILQKMCILGDMSDKMHMNVHVDFAFFKSECTEEQKNQVFTHP